MFGWANSLWLQIFLGHHLKETFKIERLFGVLLWKMKD